MLSSELHVAKVKITQESIFCLNFSSFIVAFISSPTVAYPGICLEVTISINY